MYDTELSTFDWLLSIYAILGCVISFVLIYLPFLKMCDSAKYPASELTTYTQILEKRGEDPNFVAVGWL